MSNTFFQAATTGERMQGYGQSWAVAAHSTEIDGVKLLAGFFDDTPDGDKGAEKCARIFQEAMTANAETGLTPRQLVEQRAELLAALKEVVAFYSYAELGPIAKARAAIAKAEAAQ